jgi:hypothetical protein
VPNYNILDISEKKIFLINTLLPDESEVEQMLTASYFLKQM